MDRSIEIIRERTDTLGVSEPEISRLGTDSVRVGLAGRPERRARDRPGRRHRPALLLRLGAERRPQPERAARPRHRVSVPPALRRGRVRLVAQKPECFEDTCTTTGPTYYLFDAADEGADRRTRGATKEDLFVDQPGEKQPAGSEMLAVPAGDDRGPGGAAAGRPRDLGRRERRRGEPRLLRDRATAPRSRATTSATPSSSRTRTPTSPTSPSSSPTRAGRRSRRSPGDRRARALNTAPPGSSPQDAADFSDHFAVVLDDEIVSPPDHQLRREPERDRRPHRRPDRGQLHDHRGPGPGRVPEDRRAADRAEADLAVDRLGDARRGGARPGAEGRASPA